jgi:hypothetical protein
MNKLTTASALAALAIAGPALAEDFSYDYVEPGLILADVGPADGKGPGIAASVGLPRLHENVILVGAASYLDFEGRDNYLMNLEGGLGYHFALSPILELVGTGSLVYQKNDFDSEIGPGLTAGVRAKPFGEAWELFGGLKYFDALYEDTVLEVGGRYSFSPGLSAALKFGTGDIDTVTLSLRWDINR